MLEPVANECSGPSVAFNAYTASTTILLNISYAAPIAMLLARGRKSLSEEVVAYSLGRMGIVWNWTAIIFVVFLSVVSMWNSRLCREI
jgi:choline transport protein